MTRRAFPVTSTLQPSCIASSTRSTSKPTWSPSVAAIGEAGFCPEHNVAVYDREVDGKRDRPPGVDSDKAPNPSRREQPGTLLAAQDLQDRVRRRPRAAGRKALTRSKQVGHRCLEGDGKTGQRTGAWLGWAPFQVLYVAPCQTTLVLELLTRQPHLLATYCHSSSQVTGVTRLSAVLRGSLSSCHHPIVPEALSRLNLVCASWSAQTRHRLR